MRKEGIIVSNDTCYPRNPSIHSQFHISLVVGIPAVFPLPSCYYMWHFWREEVWSEENSATVMLEVIAPATVPRPYRAMENVFAAMWQIHDPPNDREHWIDGQYQLQASIELVSTEGKIHFYLNIPRGSREIVESAVYSQYPEVELLEVDDYTKQLPADIPNAEWNLWGTNYHLQKPDSYPIKTYMDFFEQGFTGREEERVDPMAFLVESLSRLGKGEHMWIQFLLYPVTRAENDYYTRGKEIVDELAHRDPKKGASTLGQDIKKVGGGLISGNIPDLPTEKEEERNTFMAPELQLTTGERDIVGAIERKIGKWGFMTCARFIYIARRENYLSPAKALAMSYFTQFSTTNLNTFRPLSPTLTKSYTFRYALWDRRRAFMKRRRMMRNYLFRLPPYFPKIDMGGSKEYFFMNIEELATVFHFPGTTSASTAIENIPSKKAQAPTELPTNP